jgi:hypothetical protein
MAYTLYRKTHCGQSLGLAAGLLEDTYHPLRLSAPSGELDHLLEYILAQVIQQPAESIHL